MSGDEEDDENREEQDFDIETVLCYDPNSHVICTLQYDAGAVGRIFRSRNVDLKTRFVTKAQSSLCYVDRQRLFLLKNKKLGLQRS